MGAASASLLARAGVGTLTLIDRDFVDPPISSARSSSTRPTPATACPRPRPPAATSPSSTPASPSTPISPTSSPATSPNCSPPRSIILDATDNFETRYLINDFAVQQGKPWIYAAAIGAYAATMNILPQSIEPRASNLEPAPATACLACIFPKPPSGNVDTCDTAGILSTAVNLAASIQVTEALKFLTGQSQLIRRTLLSFDLWNPAPGSTGYIDRSEISAATPRPGCEVCGQRIFTHLAGENRAHITLCGRDSVQIHEHHRPVDFAAMRARLSSHADIQDLRSNDLILRFRRGHHTVTLFADGRAIVQGTTDITVARSLYARFIGA